jgi:hypothetical protein
MPHISIRGRTPAAATLTILLLAAGGLAACGSSGGSSSSSANASTNSAATGAAGSGTSAAGTTSTGTTSSGTSATGTTSTGTPATGTPPGGPGSAARTARFAAVRTCLSKKGITLPQPSPGVPGGGAQLPKGMTGTQFQEALKSCGANFGAHGNHFRRAGPAFNNPRFHAVLARFAACLRQNGINVGEPNTTGKGPVFNTKGVNTGSPQFRAASAKCRSTLLSGFRPKAAPGSTAAGGGAVKG